MLAATLLKSGTTHKCLFSPLPFITVLEDKDRAVDVT